MSKYLILLHNSRTFIGEKGTINTHVGPIDVSNAQPGDSLFLGGETFTVAQPTFMDLLLTGQRGAQIVTPKDAAQIVAVTGIGTGWQCVDGGTGSGFLALFLGHIVAPTGHVSSYEQQERFVNIARKNVIRCEMEDIVSIKNANISAFTEHDLDLITFDAKGSEMMIPKARKRLKPGGWLVIYSPHIEQHIHVREVMQNEHFIDIRGMETLQREWQSRGGYTRPHTKGLLHTGFLTLGRKLD